MGTMRSTGWFVPGEAVLELSPELVEKRARARMRATEPQSAIAHGVTRGLAMAVPIVVALAAFALVLHYTKPRWF